MKDGHGAQPAFGLSMRKNGEGEHLQTCTSVSRTVFSDAPSRTCLSGPGCQQLVPALWDLTCPGAAARYSCLRKGPPQQESQDLRELSSLRPQMQTVTVYPRCRLPLCCHTALRALSVPHTLPPDCFCSEPLPHTAVLPPSTQES